MKARWRAGVAARGHGPIILAWLCNGCLVKLHAEPSALVLAPRPWTGKRRDCNGCDTDYMEAA